MTYADTYNIRTANVKFNDVADAIDGVLKRHWGGTTTGTSTAFACSTTPTITSSDLVAGTLVAVYPHATNTGGSTLNVNSTGNKTIVYCGQSCYGGELVAGAIAMLMYDGTNWILINHGGGWASWTPTLGGTASMTLSSTTILVAKFQRHGKLLRHYLRFSGTTGGTASYGLTYTVPIAAAIANNAFSAFVADSSEVTGTGVFASTTTVEVRKYDKSNFGLGAGRVAIIAGEYEV